MIFGAVGNQRAGKTLGCVAWVLFFQTQSQYRRWNGSIIIDPPQPISTNLEVFWANHHFSDWRQMMKITPDNSIILFDEIDTAIDSRNFKSEDQIAFTHWFKQLGKRGITFFYTTQRLHMVEKRVREQTDYLFHCRKNWLNGKLTEEWFDTQAGVEAAIPITKFNLEKPERIYKLYNSFQTVATTMIGEKKSNYAPYKSKYR